MNPSPPLRSIFGNWAPPRKSRATPMVQDEVLQNGANRSMEEPRGTKRRASTQRERSTHPSESFGVDHGHHHNLNVPKPIKKEGSIFGSGTNISEVNGNGMRYEQTEEYLQQEFSRHEPYAQNGVSHGRGFTNGHRLAPKIPQREYSSAIPSTHISISSADEDEDEVEQHPPPAKRRRQDSPYSRPVKRHQVDNSFIDSLNGSAQVSSSPMHNSSPNYYQSSRESQQPSHEAADFGRQFNSARASTPARNQRASSVAPNGSLYGNFGTGLVLPRNVQQLKSPFHPSRASAQSPNVHGRGRSQSPGLFVEQDGMPPSLSRTGRTMDRRQRSKSAFPEQSTPRKGNNQGRPFDFIDQYDPASNPFKASCQADHHMPDRPIDNFGGVLHRTPKGLPKDHVRRQPVTPASRHAADAEFIDLITPDIIEELSTKRRPGRPKKSVPVVQPVTVKDEFSPEQLPRVPAPSSSVRHGTANPAKYQVPTVQENEDLGSLFGRTTSGEYETEQARKIEEDRAAHEAEESEEAKRKAQTEAKKEHREKLRQDAALEAQKQKAALEERMRKAEQESQKIIAREIERKRREGEEKRVNLGRFNRAEAATRARLEKEAEARKALQEEEERKTQAARAAQEAAKQLTTGLTISKRKNSRDAPETSKLPEEPLPLSSPVSTESPQLLLSSLISDLVGYNELKNEDDEDDDEENSLFVPQTPRRKSTPAPPISPVPAIAQDNGPSGMAKLKAIQQERVAQKKQRIGAERLAEEQRLAKLNASNEKSIIEALAQPRPGQEPPKTTADKAVAEALTNPDSSPETPKDTTAKKPRGRPKTPKAEKAPPKPKTPKPKKEKAPPKPKSKLPAHIRAPTKALHSTFLTDAGGPVELSDAFVPKLSQVSKAPVATSEPVPGPSVSKPTQAPVTVELPDAEDINWLEMELSRDFEAEKKQEDDGGGAWPMPELLKDDKEGSSWMAANALDVDMIDSQPFSTQPELSKEECKPAEVTKKPKTPRRKPAGKAAAAGSNVFNKTMPAPERPPEFAELSKPIPAGSSIFKKTIPPPERPAEFSESSRLIRLGNNVFKKTIPAPEPAHEVAESSKSIRPRNNVFKKPIPVPEPTPEFGESSNHVANPDPVPQNDDNANPAKRKGRPPGSGKATGPRAAPISRVKAYQPRAESKVAAEKARNKKRQEIIQREHMQGRDISEEALAAELDRYMKERAAKLEVLRMKRIAQVANETAAPKSEPSSQATSSAPPSVFGNAVHSPAPTVEPSIEKQLKLVLADDLQEDVLRAPQQYDFSIPGIQAPRIPEKYNNYSDSEESEEDPDPEPVIQQSQQPTQPSSTGVGEVQENDDAQSEISDADSDATILEELNALFDHAFPDAEGEPNLAGLSFIQDEPDVAPGPAPNTASSSNDNSDTPPETVVWVYLIYQRKINKGAHEDKQFVNQYLTPQEANDEIASRSTKLKGRPYKTFIFREQHTGLHSVSIIYTEEGDGVILWAKRVMKATSSLPDFSPEKLERRYPNKVYRVSQIITLRSSNTNQFTNLALFTSLEPANRHAAEMMSLFLKPNGSRLDEINNWQKIILPQIEQGRLESDANGECFEAEMGNEEGYLNGCGCEHVIFRVEVEELHGPKN